MKIDLYTKNTKKKFIFSNSLVTDCLEHHNKQMQEMLRRVYSTQLSHKQLPSLLPLLRWGPIPKKGGGLPIYLFSLAHRSREIPFFFEELISRWLIPGMRLPILSAQNHTFSLPQHKGYRFFFATLLVKLETKDQVDAARKNLFPLAKEICQGMGSSGQIRSILEMKRLSIPGKSNCIYENLYAWMQRFPKRFKKELLHEAQHFLLDCGEKFLSIRDVRHISRIISFHYLFRRHMEKKIRTTPEGRHLFLKIRPTFLHYPFGLKKVMAIVIAMNALKEYERFSLPHIISAIQKFIPSARAIKNSFYSHKVHHETTQTLYLEIEKTRGEEFFLKEFSLLQKELGPKLKQSIELLAPSLFIPRNEEELYRNIISLSRELKYVRDLPQAMISFLEQKGNHLKFNVILLRLLSLKTIPLVDKAKVLPPHIRFTHEKVTTVGTLRKKYPKQANVFSLEIETHLFLRGNYSVDLVKARQFVAKVVEMLVGPYRDYNGGLLHKQNQQLEILKEQLDDHDRRHELFVENLFYSLTPSILQTTLSVDHACVLFSLLLSTLEEELPAHTDYLIKKEIYKGDLCLVIKCNQEEIKTLVTDVLHQKTRTGLGWTSIESDGHFYLGVIMNAKGSASKVLKSIHGALTRWKRKQKNLQILKLHLSRAPLSLDPRIGTDRNSAIIIKMLYDGLMRIGLDGTPELSIAKSVEISSDKKTYRFTLKESYWSNGALLSAFDFEYAWKKILDPKFPSVYSFLFSTIKNATAVKQGELPLSELGVKAVDATELLVELERPTSWFLGMTAHWAFAPLCREIDQRHPGWAYHSAETYVCNGPFKLDVWKLNDELQLVPNPYYWDQKKITLGKIQVKIVEDQEVALSLFKEGELDWLGDPMTKIPLAKINELKTQGVLHTDPISCLFWLQLNLTRPPMTNLKVRQALSRAICRRTLISSILKSDDAPAYSFTNTPLFEEMDQSHALTLFNEGLYELKIPRSQLPPFAFYTSDFEEHEKISEAIAKMWGDTFGIEIRLEKLNWDAFVSALIGGEHTVAAIPWYPRYDETLLYYLSLFSIKGKTIDPISFVTMWSHKQFADLFEAAQNEEDPIKRLNILKQAEKILIEAMPVIPLFFQKLRYIKNSRLQNVILSNIGQIDFRESYISRSD